MAMKPKGPQAALDTPLTELEGNKVRSIDKSLGAHLAECAQQNRQLWVEIKAFKKVLWAGISFGVAAPWTIIAWLLTHPLPWIR